MRGRLPAGPEFIDKQVASVETKERLKAIIDTMYGQKRLLEACAELGIGETRFHQLRELAIQAALLALEPRPAGRPSQSALPEAEQIRALEQRIEELELALHEAQVREEIALVLPNLQRPVGEPDEFAEGKKMPSPPVKIRKSR
jgi:hypothetical protein